MSMKSRKGTLSACLSVILFVACMPVVTPPPDGAGITDEIREACPMLSDDVLEGFVLAISGLKDDGLSEADALEQWVAGCQSIPPDGNFQGDIEACETCMPVIVNVVYAGD